MNLSRENLILTEIRSNEYRFSYEPMDEVTPSAEGLIEVDKDVKVTGNNIDEPIFIDSELTCLDFKKLQVWDNEGFQEITETEAGQYFIAQLQELIKNELDN